MTRPTIQRDKLGALTKIGQGGQGVVYQAPNVKTKFAASMVYKEYKTQTLAEINFDALAAMPTLVEESLTYAQAERLISMASWPCALVEESGSTTGFVMPAIPQEFFISLTTVKGVSTATAEFQHLLNHSSVLQARGININDAQRYTLLREAASGLAFLHQHGVCVGDISPKNLLFSLNPREAVYFIDCDAMRVNGVSVQRQVETPGWEAPAGEELATIYTDTYKLGLLALRLLTGGHDTTNPQHLPSTTPDLLRQVITDTLRNEPQSRPLPEAWTYVLGHAVEYAQHQVKTATTTSGPAPDAPPVPVLHSRPSSAPSARSAPPPPPSALPPPSPQSWAPTPNQPVSPQAFTPTPNPSGSSSKLWAGVVLATVVIAAIVVVTVVLANRNNNPAQATRPAGSSGPGNSSYSPESSSPPSTKSSTESAPTPTTAAWTPPDGPPPPLVQTPDGNGETCDSYHLTNRSGWATHAGRGTPETSCIFVSNVLKSYWDTYSSAGPDSRQVIAAGTRSCQMISASAPMPVACSGDNFIMNCVLNGGDAFITCTGGNDARIYLY